MVTKGAMDAAVRAGVDDALARDRLRQQAFREAERVSRPWVGDLNLALDEAQTADDVYRITLVALGVPGLDAIHPSAYRAILEMQPKPGAAPARDGSPVRLAMDSAGARGFAERFPGAQRIRDI